MERYLKDRRMWLGFIAVAALVAAREVGLSDYVSLETLRANRQELRDFVAAYHVLATLAYIGLYILAATLSLPGLVFLTLAGGFLFGVIEGTIFTVIGATAGATLVFLFAKAIFAGNKLDRFGPPAAKIAGNIRQNAWPYLLVLRLVPLFPFFLVNLIPAFAGVPLTTYVLTTFFGIIPGAAVFSLSGAGLESILEKGGDVSLCSVLTPEVLGALFGLAALSLAAIPLKRMFASVEKA